MDKHKLLIHVYTDGVKMPTMTVRVPEDLKSEIDKHDEINWSEVIRKSMWEYIHKLKLADQIASKSELTEDDVEEMSEELKKRIAEHYG
ncbi:MAG: hypothetical protein ACOC87_04315 [Candidatus Natronoplasma sp.]